MASFYPFLLGTFVFYCSLISLCFCFENRTGTIRRLSSPSKSKGGKMWSSGGATWYGGANGDGSEGGACGYGSAVGKYPFSSMIAAGGPSVYRDGKGCGACYQVRCTENHACSQKPVTVVITDECPGGPCLSESVHFDLSGTAFGALAVHGSSNKLRDTGVLPIQYARAPCEYPHKTIAFHVDPGSTSSYLAVVIEFTDGDGSLANVELRESNPHGSAAWHPMRESWGAVWKLDAGTTLKAPLSIRVTSQHLHRKVVAQDVIPAGWKPGNTYRSLVNFS